MTALLLADGRRVVLRPLGPADRDGLVALFGRLSPESRRRRFLGPKTMLTARDLTFLTDIDHLHHEAIAAIDERDGSIVGVARYVGHADRPTAAELAVEVADELHGIGLGTALVTHILGHAVANGYTAATATTLWENRSASAILRRLGFRARTSRGRELEYEFKFRSPNRHVAVTHAGGRPA